MTMPIANKSILLINYFLKETYVKKIRRFKCEITLFKGKLLLQDCNN